MGQNMVDAPLGAFPRPAHFTHQGENSRLLRSGFPARLPWPWRGGPMRRWASPSLSSEVGRATGWWGAEPRAGGGQCGLPPAQAACCVLGHGARPRTADAALHPHRPAVPPPPCSLQSLHPCQLFGNCLVKNTFRTFRIQFQSLRTALRGALGENRMEDLQAAGLEGAADASGLERPLTAAGGPPGISVNPLSFSCN